jgi:hypothetical protein
MICVGEYAQLIDGVNGVCAPKVYAESGEKVIYINNRNHLGLFNKSTNNKTFVEGGIYKCPGGVLADKVSINLQQNIGYSYTFIIKMLLTKNVDSSSSLNLSISFNNQTFVPQINLQPTSNIIQCNTVYTSTFTFTFNLKDFLSPNDTLPTITKIIK